MQASRVNLAILFLVVAATATGLVAFSLGNRIAVLAVVLHGVAGIGIVVVGPWKAIAAGRGLRRRRDGRRLVVSLLLVGAAVAVLASGFLQTSGVSLRLGPFSTMQVHVGSAFATVMLTLVHVRNRPVKVAEVGRREFLRAGGLAVLVGLAWLGFEGTLRAVDLPGSRRRFTGSHERGSFDPAGLPVTQWFNDRPPTGEHLVRFRVAGEEWSLTSEDIDRGDQLVATLDCTSGWYSTQEWEGALLGDLIPPGAEGSIVVTSETGYRRRFPMREASRMLLATRLGGEPLGTAHGAPVRLVAPGRRGFWWIKWVASVEVDSRPAWWQLPFPTT